MAAPLRWAYKVTMTEAQMKMIDDALLLADAAMADAVREGSHPLGWSVNQTRIYEVARAKFNQEARRQFDRNR